MTGPGWSQPELAARLRRACAADEPLLFDVFKTVWDATVERMPNPDLVAHFLRIQYTAQERRLADRFPGFERWLINDAGRPVGRLYVRRTPEQLQVLEMTVLPQHRSRGIGSAVMCALMAEAAGTGRGITLRVERHNVRATTLYNGLGFRLVSTDDRYGYFAWEPEPEPEPDPAPQD